MTDPKRVPWTRQQLEELIPKIDAALTAAEEAEQPDEVKGLPPMTTAECEDYFYRLMDRASQRLLTRRECFLHGQLMMQYKMAVKAEMLGKKGRYYVISEQDIVERINQGG